MTLAIKRVHNLPPPITLVMFLHYLILHKTETQHWRAKTEAIIETWDCIPQGRIDEASGKHGWVHV